MKVLFVTDVGDKGGATNSLKELVINLRKNYNIEPIIIKSRKNDLEKFLEDNKIENYSLGYDAFLVTSDASGIKKIIKKLLIPIYYIKHIYLNYKAINKLKKSLNFKSIDIIHSNVNRNDIGAIIAKKNNIPHIWHIREYGDLDYNCYSIRSKYIKYMNNNATKFVAISDTIKQHWVNKGLDENKIERIYNGIENNNYIYNVKKSSQKVKIVFCGAIIESKGQFQAVKAIALLPNDLKNNIEFDIYGFGNKSYIDKINNFIEKNDLSSIITLKGYDRNINKKLSDYDIGIVCSKSEGFGRVTIEYAFSGVSVIASNTGANVELIKNMYNGLLYEYGNIDDLSYKLRILIENKNDIRTDLIENNYRNSINNYTSIINSKNIYNLYNEVIKNKK